LAFRRVFVARRFPFNYTVTRFHKHKEKPYGKVIPKASEGVEPMFENQNLYERLSGRENLNFYARLYRVDKSRVDQVLNQIGLERRADDKVATYSNGMKQRLLIGRALLHKPGVLFLDEPTRGLDPNIARDIRQIISELADSGMTIFLTTHYMDEADQLSDRVAIIDQGRIVALDRPAQLKAEYNGGGTSLEDVFVHLTGRHLGRGSEEL
jgi:ABC-type multidrug transport system ATPase subunit